ncbi:MAG: hypothetical protein AAFQ92_23365, partial [Bacteroidota bacterium]
FQCMQGHEKVLWNQSIVVEAGFSYIRSLEIFPQCCNKFWFHTIVSNEASDSPVVGECCNPIIREPNRQPQIQELIGSQKGEHCLVVVGVHGPTVAPLLSFFFGYGSYVPIDSTLPIHTLIFT